MKNKLLVGLFFLFFSYLGYGQVTVSVSPQGQSLCSGSQIIVTATATGGTAPYTYSWSTGETSASIAIERADTYSVTVRDQAGNTSPVGQVTVTAATTPGRPTLVLQTIPVCINTSARIEVANPLPNATYHWYDAGGNLLPTTGPVLITDPISQNTIFFVDATVATCTGERTVATVTLIENPTVGDIMLCAGNTATFTASGATTYQWYDENRNPLPQTGATFTTPVLTASTIFYVSGTTNGCTSPLIQAKAIVNPAPPKPTIASLFNLCTGSKITLVASGVNGAVYDWFTQETGGTSIISSPDFTTPVLTADMVYYVQATLNGCPGERTKVEIKISQPPQAPVVAAVAPICYNSTAQLTVSNPEAGVTYEWFTSTTAPTPFATGVTISTPALLANTSYYVRPVNIACQGSRVRVDVTVKTNPVPPAVSGATLICSGLSTTLTATAPVTGTYEWFTTATDPTPFFTGNILTTGALTANTTYYVRVVLADGCISDRTSVLISVVPPPAAPLSADQTTCFGSTAILTATNGNIYQWYDAQLGGNLLFTGQAFQTPVLTADAEYWVQNVSAGGCPSARTRVRVTITPLPGLPNASAPAPICPGTSANLTATGSTGSYRWYSAATGGTPLATTATYNTPNLAATRSYFVAAITPGGCESATRQEVVVTVTNVPFPLFRYDSGTFCNTGSTTPVEIVPGTFAGSGALIIDPNDGTINLAGSGPGTYTVTFTPTAGACSSPASITVTITTAPDAHFSYARATYCQDEGNALPVFPPGGSGGVFTSTAGLIFANPTTGEIDFDKSTAGTYIITNTITSPCGNTSQIFQITIDPRVVVNAGPNRIMAAGRTLRLNGSVSAGVTFTWTSSNPGDAFSNPNVLDPVYTPAATSGATTLTLTTSNPAGPCDAKSDEVVITIATKPANPTAAAVTICAGESTTLSATAPGGAYAWFDSNNVQVGTGPTLPVGPLSATTSFFVETTVNDLTSDRTEVVVTVNPALLQPTVTGGGPVCPGEVVLRITEVADQYRWYDADGNLKSDQQEFRPIVTQNTTFTAQIIRGTCESPTLLVTLTVNPIATVTSARTGEVCSDVAQNYTIMADNAAATFTYSRAVVADISNPAANNVSASAITEILTNTSPNERDVVYIITPSLNGCAGTPFTYTVTVYPTPVITSVDEKTICNGTSVDYNVVINPNAVNFSWSRAQVAGISNGAISGQESRGIREVLYNTTNAPIVVDYVFTYSTLTCAGVPFTLSVTVNPPVYLVNPTPRFMVVCANEAFNYEILTNADATPGVTYQWSRPAVGGNPASSGTSKTITETLINNTGAPIEAFYTITPFLNGCPGTEAILQVNVAAVIPKRNFNAPTAVCVDKPFELNYPNPVANAQYIWTGPGISTTTTVPVLQLPNGINATGNVVFNLTVKVGDCEVASDPRSIEVRPTPIVNAGTDASVCPAVIRIPLHGTVTSAGGTGKWVIISGSGSLVNAENALNNEYETSVAERVAGTVVVIQLQSTGTDNCDIIRDDITFTFEQLRPADTQAERTQEICSGGQSNYAIATTGDATPGITYSWIRNADASNAANSGTSKTISETLLNTTGSDIIATYFITPTLNGCVGETFELRVTVKPAIPKQAFTVPTAVCVNKAFEIRYPNPILNASYIWTGPDGIPVTTTDPFLPFPNGISTASLVTFNLTVKVGNCTVASNPQSFEVRLAPVVNAGADDNFCPDVLRIPLHGVITRGAGGAPSTGTWTIVTGAGHFINPDQLDTEYETDPSERAAGNTITLRLLSRGDDNCDIVTDEVTYTFQQTLVANAGADMNACDRKDFQLDGRITAPSGTGTWKTTGDGTFNGQPTSTVLNAFYTPGPGDRALGRVTLTLTANDNNACNSLTDEVLVTLIPPPTIIAADASPVRYVFKGRTITLNPIISGDANVTYLWSPSRGLNDPTARNPIVTGDEEITYSLVVISALGCPSEAAEVLIKVSPPIQAPNTFTPNADGYNDQWLITGMEAYPRAVVDIYDRQGQQVYHSIGYTRPWDGTKNGKPVPFGTYYYVIDAKEFEQKASGYITVVR